MFIKNVSKISQSTNPGNTLISTQKSPKSVKLLSMSVSSSLLDRKFTSHDNFVLTKIHQQMKIYDLKKNLEKS